MTAENLTVLESLPQTIPHFCLESTRQLGKPDVLNFRLKSAWESISAEAVFERVGNIAFGLSELGIGKGDAVAIISENRPEWSLMDLAILSLRAVTVPIYTTQAVEQIRYVLEDSSAKMLVISGKKIFKHARAAIESMERLEKLIFFDPDSVPENDARAISLDHVEELGESASARDQREFSELLDKIEPDDTATIIYTSGTTGEPKGVILTHKNFASDVLAVSKSLPIYISDRSLSVLPLSHIFERVVFYTLFSNGVAVHFCDSFDKLAICLKEVKPTIMTAVPRLFEQVYHKIVKKGRMAGGAKTRLFNWALKVGQEYWDKKENRQRVSRALAAKQRLASRLVFSKWREGVGGSIRFFVSGGAPLSKKLSYAFMAAGIPILQGYGMTEACVVSANRPDNNKVASIGIPFEGIEMKVAESDGELLIRGANVMKRYHNKSEETDNAIDIGNWYHTGDIGYEDADGHFYITDRKKDLFKLSNGKYVAPQQVESLLKQSPLIAQTVVVGSGRKQVGALIVPDWETIKQVIKDEKIEAKGTREELCANRYLVRRIQDDAVRFTSETNDYERVKRVYLLPREFSIDKGEMTPTLKIKRNVIDQKYASAIDQICGS